MRAKNLAEVAMEAAPRQTSDHAMAILSGILIVVAVVAGGSSSDPLSAGLVRLVSLPALMFAIWRLAFRPPAATAIWLIAIMAMAVIVTLAQLIPLPPEMWGRLAGRQTVTAAYRAAAMPLPQLPVSLAPAATWNGLLGILPPLAMFLSVLSLAEETRRRLALLLVVLAIVSIAVGALQMFGGEDSPLRPYQFTNRNAAVGFFANRNHQASFLAAMIPMVAALAAMAVTQARGSANFVLVLAGSAVLVLVLGVGITLSRAGVLLLAPALLASLLIATRGRATGWSGGISVLPAFALAGSMLLGAALIAAFQFTPLAQRFLEGEQTRPEVSARVASVGLGYAPLGSGVGSFEAVYQMHEPTEALSVSYFNHVHNDYVEVWLEAGWPGVALLAAFLTWWVATIFTILNRQSTPSQALALAGAAVTGMLLIHSIVDYPIRTAASAVVVALACGLMIPARRHPVDGQ